MPVFTDKSGHEWRVDLDPVIADEIKQDHGIQIANLELDPMQKLRNDTGILCSVMLVICRDQIESLSLTREQFLKRLPFPPDSMLSAIEESIVCFFPTGRHSHAQEVLASFAHMASKTDALTIAKMQGLTNNPQTMQMLSDRADREIEKAVREMSVIPGT